MSYANKRHRMELLFILLFRYVRQVRSDRIRKMAAAAAERAKQSAPVLMK